MAIARMSAMEALSIFCNVAISLEKIVAISFESSLQMKLFLRQKQKKKGEFIIWLFLL